MNEPWPRGRSRHGGVDRVPLPAPVAGRLWLAGKHYVGPDPVAALAECGCDTVVCLCESFEFEDRYPDYAAWLDSSSEASVWWPVPDLHAPPLESARSLVTEIARRLDGGEGVLVHCGAGMGRAGTVAAAVLIHYGSSVAGALEVVAAARAGAGPEAGVQKELLERMG
jgi:hypothetical protein